MKFSPQNLANYAFLSNLRISPDAKKAVYQVSRLREKENDYTNDLYLLEVESKKFHKLTGSGKDRGAFWENESTLLFTSGRDAKDDKLPQTRYYRIRIDGGEAEPAFTVPIAVEEIKALTKGEWLLIGAYDPMWENVPEDENKKQAFIQEKEKEKNWKVLDELPYWFNGQGYTNKKRSRLYRFSENEAVLTPLTDTELDVASLTVNEEKTRAAVVLTTKKEVMELSSRIGLIDLSTNELEIVDPVPDGTVYFVEFSGTDLFFAATDRKTRGLNEDPHIFRMDPKGKVTQITKDTFELSLGGSVNCDLRRGGSFQFRADDEALYFIATDNHNAHLHKITKDGVLSPVITRDGSVDGFDVKNGTVITVGLHDLQAQELYDTKERITHHNQDVPKPRPVERFPFESRGEERTGFVIAPRRKKKDKKSPAILMIHGGPKTVYGDILHHEMQLLAEEGFYVFYTNPFGSDGYGRDFMDLRGKYGTADYEDLMACTDAFLEKYPDADEKRLGVMGGSYGGWMTNWIIGHTDRFRAACSQRSISNWISFFGNSDIGYFFTPDQVGSDPWQDADLLWNNSPLKYADQAKTPTLFIHSDEDYRCWLPEGLQMYTALKYHGVPSRMVVFHGENHELSRGGKPQSRIKRLEEIVAWFTEYLM